jgi:dTDP-4-dehydrorhamnose reductase
VRILLTGSRGQVGWELRRTLATLGELVSPDRNVVDLSNPDSIRIAVRDIRPTLIVNAGAYTAVDKAEQEQDLAQRVNGLAPGILAEEAKTLGAALVHYSTDYVFDGSKSGAYREGDVPNPVNVYGKSKLAGETAIQQVGVPHLIFRTSWVYGTRGRNFLLTMLRLAQEKDEIRVVDDQIGAPTWSRTIAEVTAQVLAQSLRPSRSTDSPWAGMSGIFHLSCGGQTSWYGFATAILARVPAEAGRRVAAVVPIPTRDYPTPAVRPLNSLLSNERLAARFRLRQPSWEECLAMCLEKLSA